MNVVRYETENVTRIDAASRYAARVAACATVGAGRRVATTPSGYTLIELLIAVAIMLTLSAIAGPGYSQALYAAKMTRAIGEVRTLSGDVLGHMLIFGELPVTLADLDKGDLRDPWGNPYQYLNFAIASGGGGGDSGGRGGGGGSGGGKPVETPGAAPPPAGARRDRFLVPINSLYDLYSMGPDGQSLPPLLAPQSWDDIIMAADGAFIGLAKDF